MSMTKNREGHRQDVVAEETETTRAEVEAVVEVTLAVVSKEEEEMVATEPPMLEDLAREP